MADKINNSVMRPPPMSPATQLPTRAGVGKAVSHVTSPAASAPLPAAIGTTGPAQPVSALHKGLTRPVEKPWWDRATQEVYGKDLRETIRWSLSADAWHIKTEDLAGLGAGFAIEYAALKATGALSRGWTALRAASSQGGLRLSDAWSAFKNARLGGPRNPELGAVRIGGPKEPKIIVPKGIEVFWVHDLTNYRGDTRSPEDIIKAGGFRSLGKNLDLAAHVEAVQLAAPMRGGGSGFISTTRYKENAIHYASSGKDNSGWVYKIRVARGIDPEETFPDVELEDEVVVPLFIPLKDVLGAWRVNADGILVNFRKLTEK